MPAITAEQVALLIDRAAALAAIPVEAVRLVFIVETNGSRGPYRTDAISPADARGLFQLQEPAWRDARRVDARLPAYRDGWNNPAMSAWAAALYLRFLAGEARRLGHRWRITPNVLYAMYNQGVGGFSAMLSRGRPVAGRQTELARTLIRFGMKDASEN